MENLTVKTKSSNLDGLSLILTVRLMLKAAQVAALAQAVVQAQEADLALAVVQAQAADLAQAVDLVRAVDLALAVDLAQEADLAQAVAAVALVPVVQLMIGAHTFIKCSKMLSGLNLILMSMLSCSNHKAMLATQVATLLLRS